LAPVVRKDAHQGFADAVISGRSLLDKSGQVLNAVSQEIREGYSRALLADVAVLIAGTSEPFSFIENRIPAAIAKLQLIIRTLHSPQIGTRLGGPVASVLFNFSFVRVVAHKRLAIITAVVHTSAAAYPANTSLAL
jgi:hypothetical protein